MRKRWFLIGMVLLLVPVLFGGCGVAQEQYDTVVSDLGKAQQEVQSVKAELEAAQAKVSELTASLEKAEAELETTQAKNSELTSSLGKVEKELEAAQAELDETKKEVEAERTKYETFKSNTKSLWVPLDKQLSLNTNILGVSAGFFLDDLDMVYRKCLDIKTSLAVLNDSALNARWEAAYAEEEGQWKLTYASFERFMAEHNARIKSIVNAIREKLPE